MKKALAQVPASRPARAPFTLPTRLVGSLTLLALLGGLGLMASRPAHTAGGPVPVTVTNSPLYAVTQASDDPARQPVSVTQRLFGAPIILYTVPAGKRLVVEYISTTASQSLDANGYNFVVSASQGGQIQDVSFNELPDAAPYSAASQNVRLYADAGTDVNVSVYSSQKNQTDVSFTLIGHLVDVP